MTSGLRVDPVGGGGLGATHQNFGMDALHKVNMGPK